MHIIRRLLIADHFLKLEDLAEELFVSRSTLNNDFKEVKRTLKNYGISIDARPNYGIRLKGDEMRLRFCMSEFIINRSSGEQIGGLDNAPRILAPGEMT